MHRGRAWYLNNYYSVTPQAGSEAPATKDKEKAAKNNRKFWHQAVGDDTRQLFPNR